jgi:tRNA A-37 threonylcarbamoyl transferase component Bud32
MSEKYQFENISKNKPENIFLKKEALRKEIYKKIEEIRLRGNSIGLGKTAEVFVSEHDPDICYKIIFANSERFRNDVHKESEILNKAFVPNSDVDVPKPYYSIITEGEPSLEALVMERMHATSVKDILEKKLGLPDNFDFSSFYKELSDFFEKLHAKKIFHRDAHWGNIMINDKTGQPCVIDFGTAKESLLSMENPYLQETQTKDTVIFTDDMLRIQEVMRELKLYIYNKSQLNKD